MRKDFAALATAFCIALPLHAADAAKYKEADVADGGVISGKVMAGSAEVESQDFTIAKNPEVCGTGSRTVEWVRTNGDALLDTVVYLEEVKEGKPFAEAAKTVTIDQQKCAFAPYMQTMMNEGEMTVVNSDPVLHNIHTYELIKRARRTVFNVSQPTQNEEFAKKVKLRRGTGMKIECDAHDFMHAWVFVARNPYYALVDENGAFEIADVPPGEYVIKSWHGHLGETESTVTVEPGGSAAVDFSY